MLNSLNNPENNLCVCVCMYVSVRACVRLCVLRVLSACDSCTQITYTVLHICAYAYAYTATHTHICLHTSLRYARFLFYLYLLNPVAINQKG